MTGERDDEPHRGRPTIPTREPGGRRQARRCASRGGGADSLQAGDRAGALHRAPTPRVAGYAHQALLLIVIPDFTIDSAFLRSIAWAGDRSFGLPSLCRIV